MKIKILLIILPSILLVAIIASLIITVINIKTNNVTVSYTEFRGTNPSSTIINPPTASTVIYSSTGGIIGKIYGQEEKAYQYEENPSLYQGTSILYHLINIPPYSSNQTDLAIAIKLKDQLLTMLLNIGASSIIVSGEYPISNALIYISGFIAEPCCLGSSAIFNCCS